MVLTTAISLGLLGAGLLAVRTIDRTQDLYYSQLAVQVALDEPTSAGDDNCSSPTCSGLRDQLQGDPLVSGVSYESRDAAYQRFLRIYAGQSILQLVRPQSLPATLRVTLRDPTRGDAIVSEYTGRPGVRNVVDQRGPRAGPLHLPRERAQRGVRAGVDPGARRPAADLEHHPGLGVHPADRGRDHASRGRHPLVHPGARSSSRR